MPIPSRPPAHRPAWAKPPELARLERNRAADATRRAAAPWRAWYGTARWKARRALQLATEPLCCLCQHRGRLTRATVADHVEPHRGDEFKFWFGPLQSVCAPCHNRDKQRIEATTATGHRRSRI